MNTIVSNGVNINYVIKTRGTKNLNARLNDGVIYVSVPYLVSKKTIEKFVSESYFKLIKRVKKKKEINKDKINVLGVIYEDVKDIDYLLTIELKKYLKENYLEICKKLNIEKIPNVYLKRVKGYLGEYNKKKNSINLNILVAHLDKECVEYVLIHELVHTRYMNHQKEFWDEVSKYMKDYKKIRLRCKKEFIYYENY